ncbi:Hypp3733 [Branchiostoma lanceolatum]|uniref:Hypp3733 protein n=1 Tax=Branchiostoma lanceolatum TaxID=7740 RepID=A0A8K0EYM1_BRALA|nr:Hypp3733 [Branchiostoma lanceolatum]
MVNFTDWYIPVFMTIAIVVLTIFFALVYYFEPCLGMIGWNATDRKLPASINEISFSKRSTKDDTNTALIQDVGSHDLDGSQDFDGSRENLTDHSILQSGSHIVDMGYDNKAMTLDEPPQDDMREKGTQTPPKDTELRELNAKNLEKDVATAGVQTTPQKEYTILKSGSTERTQTPIKQQGSGTRSSALPGQTNANGDGEWATISWTTQL